MSPIERPRISKNEKCYNNDYTYKANYMGDVCSRNIKFFENLAYHSAKWASSPWAYVTAVGFTLAWLTSGPFLRFSSNWELAMRVAGGAVTFLMVFLIQRSQDKNSLAMQLKLNEIIASLNGPNNHMISIENLSEDEINSLKNGYQNLATQIHQDNKASTHSVSMEEMVHQFKETF
jgi:hypothetical protein